MKGSFVKKDRQCDVTVTKLHLRCAYKYKVVEIKLQDILAVENQTSDISNVNTIVVHYARSKKDNTLVHKKLVISEDTELCNKLTDALSHTRQDLQKSRHYLVVINPNSGHKTASRLFHKTVLPLFRACNIDVTVYETTGPGDCGNAFQDVDFVSLDGVISVGGDGLLSEVLTALVHYQQQLLGNSVDDPDVDIPPFPFPVGIIPAGTGNYAARYLHGTTDVVTSAIKIILAETTPLNMASVHQGNRLEGMCHLISSFGLIGDMMQECEQNRWMGSIVRKILPFRTILSRRLINAKVEFMTTETQQWQSVIGQFYSIETFIVDLVDSDDKLVPVFADSALTLHMTSACTLCDHIKQLSKVAAHTAGAFNYDFIQMKRVLKYRVHLPTLLPQNGEIFHDETFYMNVDGEPLHVNTSDFQVSLHRGVLQVFGNTKLRDTPTHGSAEINSSITSTAIEEN